MWLSQPILSQLIGSLEVSIDTKLQTSAMNIDNIYFSHYVSLTIMVKLFVNNICLCCVGCCKRSVSLNPSLTLLILDWQVWLIMVHIYRVCCYTPVKIWFPFCVAMSLLEYQYMCIYVLKLPICRLVDTPLLPYWL